MPRLPLIALALLLPAALPARAWDSAGDGLRVHCDQPGPDRIDCDYRSASGQGAGGIRAQAGDAALPVSTPVPYPWAGAVSAILFMVDTSDPGRAPVVEKNRGQVAAMLSAGKTQDRFGLAAFDSELRMLAPIGAPSSDIATAADGLRATGMTTELYRSVLQAVETLSRTPADRRAVVLLSDGQAEDQAYFHEDVTRAAMQGGVVIESIGFPRSVARSVALQSLRRLSDETGGRFVESDMRFELPADFAAGVLAAVDSGARFSIDLRPAERKAGVSQVELTLAMPSGPVTLDVPIARPAAPAPASARTAAGPPAAAPAPRAAMNAWLWYGVPLALLVLIALAVMILVMLIRLPPVPKRAAAPPAGEARPLAYLIGQDSRGARYAIRSANWRIGRSRDNEMTLDDTSVSRRHAEILRTPDGKFTIVDCQSTNGVYVNNQRVERREIHDGDLLEIGDVVLRFSEAPADHPVSEDTAMLRTRAPH